ncbi:MAG: HEAT repeat domain-containing protein, partial [Deltaproteobacteria bacterium]|nr:HEAT repeat domain-containing protein [Deltaproteobacteria bacterium]
LLLAATDNRILVTLAIVTVAALVLLLIRSVRRGYIATLEQRLGVQRQQVHHEIDPADRVTRQALVRALRSEQPRAVLTALSVLERDRGFDLSRSLLHLLGHNDQNVRLAAIERAGRTRDPQIAAALRAILATDQRRPRAYAARILPTVDPEYAAEALRPYLHDPDPGVRVAAAGALLPLELEGEGPAHAVLGSLLGGTDHPPPVRRELAKLFGELGDHSFMPTLVQLLHDPEPSVRRLACQSAAKLRHPDLVDELIGLHTDRAARAAARRALTAYGDSVVPRLEQLLNDRAAPLGLRLETPRVLRAIGTDAAAAVLLFSNIADNATLRYRIASALFEMKRANPELELDATRVDEAALRRLHAYRYYRPTLRTLQHAKHPAYTPLVRALGDRVSQNLEMALRLIGLLRDGDVMMRIFACLDERGSGLRAEALELIDVALSGDRMRAWLLDFIEEETLPGTVPEDELRTLLSSRDPLLRGLAEVVADKLGVQAEVDERGDLVDMEGESMERPFIERMLLLENVDLFARLSMDDLSAIAAIAGEREMEPGAVIYREGEPGEVMFVIIEGAVDLLKGGSAIMRLHAGESLGQTSIMDAGPRPVTARVVEGGAGAKLLVIERAAFMDLCSDHFELVTGLFTVMGQRIRALIDLTGGAHG